MDGPKPGWKTTEFWGKLAVQVMTLWGAVQGFVPPKYAVIVSAGLEGVYNLGRVVVKAINDIQAAKTETSTVTTTAPTTTITTPGGTK